MTSRRRGLSESVGGVAGSVRFRHATGAEVIKVACVGDSITRGTFVWRRKKRSYPAQLQAMLGERFCVRNFGVNGHAVQQDGRPSVLEQRRVHVSGAFEPDIVLIMLGTNDSRGDNWKGVGPFSADYRKLIVHYQSLESGPRVWLLTPPALFRLGRSAKVRYGMDERAIQEMCGAIESLALELGCGIIDINGVTAVTSGGVQVRRSTPGRGRRDTDRAGGVRSAREHRCEGRELDSSERTQAPTTDVAGDRLGRGGSNL